MQSPRMVLLEEWKEPPDEEKVGFLEKVGFPQGA
jgi:hypothetical protein